MATIRDVAKHARVSPATVSAVLNRSSYVSSELTARVNEAVDALDFTINELARGLQTRRTARPQRESPRVPFVVDADVGQ